MAAKKVPERIHPVILSGGSGERLWPLSRALYPKQLLALHSEKSLLQDTALRVRGRAFAAPVVVCNDEHRFMIAEQLRAVGITPAATLLEPIGRNTAPAVAVAAHHVVATHGDGLLLILPSDHVIAKPKAFQRAIETGARAARDGALVTFGIVPSRPETGYGYIRRGRARPGIQGCFALARFVEKPDLATARRYLANGGYDWNSGIFLLGAKRYLAELERLSPGVAGPAKRAYAKSRIDLGFTRLDAKTFAAATSLSIDYAVMEKTDSGVVVPVDMGWSDIGSFEALLEIGKRDADGNLISGDVVAHDVRNSYLRGDGRLVVAIGLEDTVIVATNDVVLAAPRHRTQEVKAIVATLKRQGRSEALTHPVVYRPWGTYQTLDVGDGFQVKHIMVKPGGKLSLQLHRHRAEHWVVVSGTARVTRGTKTITLKANQSTYIPVGTKHRIENFGRAPLRFIEVQSGGYLGEDDIVRFDDVYGRR